jgi:hypothetical protein
MTIGKIVEGVSFEVVGNTNIVSNLDTPVEGKMFHVKEETGKNASYLFVPCKSGTMFVAYDKGIPVDGIEIIKENAWDELYSSGVVAFPTKGNVVIVFKDRVVTHGMLGKTTPVEEVIIVKVGGSVPVTMMDNPPVGEDGVLLNVLASEETNKYLDEKFPVVNSSLNVNKEVPEQQSVRRMPEYGFPVGDPWISRK